MNRQLLCRKCGDTFKEPHREDIQMGWRRRRNWGALAQPSKDHGITMNGQFTPMEDYHCDSCGEKITGSIAVAETNWNANREHQPGCWEEQYGKVLDYDTVKMSDKLVGKHDSGGLP